MRIKLLDRLREGDATVGELQEALAHRSRTSPSTSGPRPAGMVSRTKQGNHARYAISDPSVFDLCDQVCGGVRRQLLDLEAILQPTSGR